jgi:hypothetical protein
MTVTDFASAIIAFRDQTGASVVSWGRTITLNRRYRATPNSPHLVDLAVDVVYDKPMSLRVVRAFADALGLILRRESHHDHLEPFDGGA